MTLRIRLAATAAALALALAGPALAQPPADPLPDAPGKDAVVRVCTACHEAAQFAFARHTPEELSKWAKKGGRPKGSKDSKPRTRRTKEAK